MLPCTQEFLALGSAIVFALLGGIKMYLATKLNSFALKKDGITSLAVCALSLGIIVSSIIIEKEPSVWWLDAVAALTISGILFAYGVRSLTRNKWYKKEFWK